MRILTGVMLAMALTACATAPQHPQMRPLTPAHIETMGATRIVVAENNNGVEKSWFYTSTAAAGAAYGLIGAVVTATMDAIINAGPSRRAQNAADEIAALFPVDRLNASLVAQFRQQTPEALAAAAEAEAAAAAAAAVAEASAEGGALTEASATTTEVAPARSFTVAPTGVWYENVESAQRLTARTPLEDAVEVTVRYTLSEDASTLRVIATANYTSAATPYTTPYTFEGSPPRAERSGPAYRNTFTYYSTQLEVPTLTPELRERLIASIQASARDENGNPPEEGSSEYQSMQRELENARDDELTKNEISIFLTREWLRDEGALLHREIEQAHAFIARYVLLDLNRTIAPSLTGTDEMLETADNRVIRRVGAGTEAGAYISSAVGVTSFSTYGNTIGIARPHNERIGAIRSAARSENRRSR